MMYRIYYALTYLIAPFIPLLLKKRLKNGKEDPVRIDERLGNTLLTRPPGKLVWIHAASVGEANTVLPLITALHQVPIKVLLTTVTVTSARLMQDCLPEGVIHQFAPIDTPQAMKRFLRHWQPDIALWVDSEFWPNMIRQAHKNGATLGIVNARMSEKSFHIWHYLSFFSKPLLQCFTFCFAQSDGDAKRLELLGIPSINHIGNLKHDALPLPDKKEDREALQLAIANRPVWLAASTHAWEEKIIARTHKELVLKIPGLLTIIVPRHAVRGGEIAAMLRAESHTVSQRSHDENITQETGIYLADTMGELGLFYRLSPIALIGGSLVAHGGQNPLEAARLNSAIILGPHMENFSVICSDLQENNAAIQIHHDSELPVILERLLTDKHAVEQFAQHALAYTKSKPGMLTHIMNGLQPYLE
jgi:3-deoxy-D-manno-octulosonic-acid transferase